MTLALTSHADATRLRVAHEEYLITDLFHRLGPILFVRHLWGVANEAADKSSRFLNTLAEDVLRGLGLQPEWTSLPQWVASYFERVVIRLRAMHLPPLVRRMGRLHGCGRHGRLCRGSHRWRDLHLYPCHLWDW